MQRIFHTPDGVRDIYNGECKKKKSLMHDLMDVFHSYNYKDIETPTFEFMDVFGKEVGTTPAHELFRFFDRDGNTLVLRPDFTPSIARAVSMYFEDQKRPLRLCYEGSTFANSSEYQGRLKETTQMGVERIGDSSAEADAEIILLTIDLLKKAGLREFQVSVGEVNFFKSLADESGLSRDTVDEVRRLILSKNFFGVSELLDNTSLSGKQKDAFASMPQLFGGFETLEKAKSLSTNKRTDAAIHRLEDIFAIIKERDLEKYVSFDFGSLSQYEYYTGIIFSAFTYGSGEPVAKGGRYDSLLGHFGKDEPAIGVGVTIDTLMTALARMQRRGEDQ